MENKYPLNCQKGFDNLDISLAKKCLTSALRSRIMYSKWSCIMVMVMVPDDIIQATHCSGHHNAIADSALCFGNQVSVVFVKKLGYDDENYDYIYQNKIGVAL